MDFIFILDENQCQDNCLNCPHLKRFVGYDGENVKECDHRKGAYHAAYQTRYGATTSIVTNMFRRFPASGDRPILNIFEQLEEHAGPDVEASHIIAEWKKGRSSTEIARLLNIPEWYVANILRREILEHPENAFPQEERKKPETITRLKALKREMQKKARK